MHPKGVGLLPLQLRAFYVISPTSFVGNNENDRRAEFLFY